MNQKSLFLVAVLAVFLASGCTMVDDGSAGTSLSGTVTVSDASQWTNLKIGFFPAFGENDGLDFYREIEMDGEYHGFLLYDAARDGSTRTFAPVKSKEMGASGSLSQSYTFSLPADPQVSTDSTSYSYQLAAWADADGDNAISLIDQSWASATSENAGEKSFLPNKEMGGDKSAYLYNWTYAESDMSSGYKYSGYDGFTNYATDLDDDTQGFDFYVH